MLPLLLGARRRKLLAMYMKPESATNPAVGLEYVSGTVMLLSPMPLASGKIKNSCNTMGIGSVPFVKPTMTIAVSLPNFSLL